MRYMPILPIGMAKLLGHRSVRDAFILPQFWGNERYRAMYAHRKWDTVIIDNAMYENPDPVPFETLIDIAGEIDSGRTFIVVPEDHSDPVHTAQLAMDTCSEYGTFGPKWNAMCIIHGSPLEIKEMMAIFHDAPIAFGIAVSTWRNGYSRIALAESCGGRDRYLHAMGLDSISEMMSLRYVFDSVDSSMVATAAINKIPLNENTVIRRTGVPTDPIRVPILQDAFLVECIDKTEKNIQSMVSWLDH